MIHERSKSTSRFDYYSHYKYNLNKDKNTQRKQKVWEHININGGTVPLLLLSRKNGGTVPLLLLASMAEQFHFCLKKQSKY